MERRNRIEDANLRRILDDVDKLTSAECFNNVAAQWTFETNVNEVTQQASVNYYYLFFFSFAIEFSELVQYIKISVISVKAFRSFNGCKSCEKS